MNRTISDIEKDLSHVLDRIYGLMEKKAPLEVLEIEYGRAVEKMTEKYAIKREAVVGQDLGETDKEKVLYDMELEFKSDLIGLAEAIDKALGIEFEPEDVKQ